MYAPTYCSQPGDDTISVIAIDLTYLHKVVYSCQETISSQLYCYFGNSLQYCSTERVKMKYTSITSLLFFSSTFFVANGFVSPHLGKPRTTTPFTDINAAADTAATAVDTSTTDAGTSNDMGAAAISALTKNVKTIFSLEDINKILPHRYPFLLVDKVVEYDVGKVCLLLF